MKSLIIAIASIGLALAGDKDPRKPMAPDQVATAGSETVQVYVTIHGKVYHTWRDCGRLDKAKTVYKATEAAAEAHGLTICQVCAHRHHSQTVPQGNGTWAQPEVKSPAK